MTSVSFRDRRRLAAVYKEARSAPVFCKRHGKPCVVIVAVEAYDLFSTRREGKAGSAPIPRQSNRSGSVWSSSRSWPFGRASLGSTSQA